MGVELLVEKLDLRIFTESKVSTNFISKANFKRLIKRTWAEVVSAKKGHPLQTRRVWFVLCIMSHLHLVVVVVHINAIHPSLPRGEL